MTREREREREKKKKKWGWRGMRKMTSDEKDEISRQLVLKRLANTPSCGKRYWISPHQKFTAPFVFSQTARDTHRNPTETQSLRMKIDREKKTSK